MEFGISQKWSDDETDAYLCRELEWEQLRLDELERLSNEDALLAAAIMDQEQRDFDEERREQERLEREERERQAKLLLQTKRLGCQVAVRQVSDFGHLYDLKIDEIKPDDLALLTEVKNQFSMTLPNCSIKKIEWIINPRLEEQFENARQTLGRFGHSTKELILFHGTAPGNIHRYRPSQSQIII